MRKRSNNGKTEVESSNRENNQDIRGGGQNRRIRRFSLQKLPYRSANIPSDDWQSSGTLGFVNEQQGNQVDPAKQGDRRGSHLSIQAGFTYKNFSQPRKSSTYKKLIRQGAISRRIQAFNHIFGSQNIPILFSRSQPMHHPVPNGKSHRGMIKDLSRRLKY
jgi:hypothetical protein